MRSVGPQLAVADVEGLLFTYSRISLPFVTLMTVCPDSGNP